MTKTLTLLLLILTISRSAAASITENKTYSLRFGSFTHHINNKEQYTDEFDNKMIALGVSINNSTHIVAGSLNNSYGDRCALLGIGKNWHQFTSKLSFEGLYSYVGEFFLNQLDHCGKQGIYQKFESATGIGFAPYIYHGLKYKLHANLSVEMGLIVPQVLVGAVRVEF